MECLEYEQKRLGLWRGPNLQYIGTDRPYNEMGFFP
jgi:hypothetical protein